jgi:hypothetical protein
VPFGGALTGSTYSAGALPNRGNHWVRVTGLSLHFRGPASAWSGSGAPEHPWLHRSSQFAFSLIVRFTMPPATKKRRNTKNSQSPHQHAQFFDNETEHWNLQGFTLWSYTRYRYDNHTADNLERMILGAWRQQLQKIQQCQSKTTCRRYSLATMGSGKSGFYCHLVFHLGGGTFRCV